MGFNYVVILFDGVTIEVMRSLKDDEINWRNGTENSNVVNSN